MMAMLKYQRSRMLAVKNAWRSEKLMPVNMAPTMIPYGMGVAIAAGLVRGVGAAAESNMGMQAVTERVI